MKTDRMARVNRLVQAALAEIVPSRIKDPRVHAAGIMAITSVRTTPDLRYATVYISFNGTREQQRAAIEGLGGASKFIRAELGRRVHLKFTPEPTFKLDDVIESAAHIESILQELATDDDHE